MAFRPGKCRLPYILREKKISLSELEKLTGIRLQQLSDYCYNRRTMSLPNAFNISFSLGVPIEDLYEVIETPRKGSAKKSE